MLHYVVENKIQGKWVRTGFFRFDDHITHENAGRLASEMSGKLETYSGIESRFRFITEEEFINITGGTFDE